MTDYDVDDSTPAMPNSKNKLLADKVSSYEKDVHSLDQQIREVSSRVESMSDHMKNVQNELALTQNLVNARINEIESEEHMRMLAEREQGRMKLAIKSKNDEIVDIKERLNIHENNIFRYTQRIEQIKSQMKWNQKELEEWLEEAAHREEDAMTLVKYAKIDDSKVKDLTLKMEKLTTERGNKKNLLDKEVTTTLTTQIELDKTADAFRKAHDERMNVLEQWENIITQMQRRDEEMEAKAEELRLLKEEIRKTENVMDEKRKFLENEQENNHEKEKTVDVSERQVAKTRIEYQNVENSRVQFKDELETLKYSTERTNTELETRRGEINQLKKDLKARLEKLEHIKNVVQEAKDSLARAADASLTAEQRAVAADEFLSKEQSWVSEVEKEIRRLREQQFRRNQEISLLKTQQTNKTAEIQGFQAASRNLSSKLHKVDQEALKQHEIIYNQDYQLQTLERKVARMQGDRSDEEREAINAKIKQLTDQFNVVNDSTLFIQEQLKKLTDDIRRADRELTESIKEKNFYNSKIDELNLHNDSTNRALKKTIAEKEDNMVEHNILKLEVKRLRDTLEGQADGVLNIDKKRLQLKKAMDERNVDIKIHTDMLQQQVKHATTEKAKISAELHERCSQIDKLQKRYEILMTSMAPPEGEEERSAAYYVIAAAQEKEELQRKGDELDAKIRKTEKETRALENTIKVMNARNHMYRTNFQTADSTSTEAEEERILEDQRRAIMDKYKYKRRQVKELQEDMDTMGRTYDNLCAELNTIESHVNDNESRHSEALKQLDDQKAKLDRVSKQLVRYNRDIRQMKGSKTQTLDEEDIELRELAEFNKSISTQLVSSIQNYPEAFSTLSNLMYQNNIPIPTATTGTTKVGSRSSSRSSSVTSLISAGKVGGKSVKSTTFQPDFRDTISPERDSLPSSAGQRGRARGRTRDLA